MKSSLPYFISGKVVKGFGRGSKSLGTPTANFEQSIVNQLPNNLPTGIYFGWAQINELPVYPMVTSLGWNPYFGNNTKSMETHIMHQFSEDFYGAELKICLAGYLRDEKDFQSLDDLKAAIQHDIEEAKRRLSATDCHSLARNSFFTRVDLDTNLKETVPSPSSPTGSVTTKA